jgi:ferric-dicitrate binding protein FerR (iron transport regulator)
MLRRAILPLAAVWLPLPALAARTRVGEVTQLDGSAVALFSGEPPRTLAPAAPIMIEDLLSTGPATRFACRLEGGQELRLGENASLRVDRSALRGARPGTAIRSFGGAVLMDLPPADARAGRGATTLTLPWAAIGVRGTRFFAGTLDGRNAVFVERGQVEVSAAGQSAVLNEGEGVDVAEGGPPGPVTRWGAPRIARAMALVI